MTLHKLTIEEMDRIDVERFGAASKLPLVLVLDDIRSLYNVGSMFRTADAFRLSGLYLCGLTSQPPSAEIHKTALGAEYSVAWHYFASTLEAVKSLRSEGYELLAVEQVAHSNKLDTFRFDLSKKYALVVGNEVKGVKQEVVDYCGQALEIPQYGTKHSMNVSVTAGIVMWEFYRQIGMP